MAAERLNGTEISKATVQVKMDPQIKTAAPTRPPPVSVSDGFQSEENRNKRNDIRIDPENERPYVYDCLSGIWGKKEIVWAVMSSVNKCLRENISEKVFPHYADFFSLY